MNYNELLKKRIEKIYLIIWPPYGETERKDIDISLGFFFYGHDKLCVVTTNKENNWTPLLVYKPIPKHLYSFEIFYNRISDWQNCELQDALVEEYYDFTASNLFYDIVEHEIIDIEMISIKGSIFGVKIKLKNDYVISTPIADGNTIETKNFCFTNNLEVYKQLGEIKFDSILK